MRALQPSRGPWQLRRTQPSRCFDVQERRSAISPDHVNLRLVCCYNIVVGVNDSCLNLDMSLKPCMQERHAHLNPGISRTALGTCADTSRAHAICHLAMLLSLASTNLTLSLMTPIMVTTCDGPY